MLCKANFEFKITLINRFIHFFGISYIIVAKKYMSLKSTILVIVQIATMIFLVVANNPIASGLGLFIQIIGVLLGLWGILSLKIGNFNIQPEVKSDALIQTGPYKWIRNPMYSGVLLFFIPIVLQQFDLINAFMYSLLLTILILKINSEEQFLEERFGESYKQYEKSTKRLIPFLY